MGKAGGGLFEDKKKKDTRQCAETRGHHLCLSFADMRTAEPFIFLQKRTHKPQLCKVDFICAPQIKGIGKGPNHEIRELASNLKSVVSIPRVHACSRVVLVLFGMSGFKTYPVSDVLFGPVRIVC